MKATLRFLWALLRLLMLPVLIAIPAVALLLVDLFWLVLGRRRAVTDVAADNTAASVVIPNWNGRDLLEKYLPSVVAAMELGEGGALDGERDPLTLAHQGSLRARLREREAGGEGGHSPNRNEVIVVDNGSTDGSVEFLRERFPQVRVIALEKNLGFGGGSNAGFRAAKNDIVVLLNSDMRVAPDFLAPLLTPFADPKMFAVACQIFFSDPKKIRQETGLTQAWWQDGMLRVRHREDDQVTGAYPCFYPGGGSSAFDRRKFLELGGFDELLAPFYLEDNDVGYRAWKRGWKVMYQPASHVWHEHRGTIGKTFSREFIASILEKNFLLWVWKNVHDARRIAEHWLFAGGGTAVSLFAGESLERASLRGLLRAIGQLPGAMASRWESRSLAVVGDREAFRRPLGGYFWDRFGAARAESLVGPLADARGSVSSDGDVHANDPNPLDHSRGCAKDETGGRWVAARSEDSKLRVLMISPYAIEPPVHGGAVFMSQTARELTKHCELHLIVLLDTKDQIAEHRELAARCGSFAYLVRMRGEEHSLGSHRPHAVREYANRDLEWLMHRQIYTQRIDVVQIEYANMGQYLCAFRRIVSCIFEHDVYFQSIGRQLERSAWSLKKVRSLLEYVRALPWELKTLRRAGRIQVCTRENAEYLASFDRALASKIDTGLRAGITAANYEFRREGRTPDTMLFLGSFRHDPNMEALMWFATEAMPPILELRPSARLIAVGSDPPPRHALPALGGAIEIRGFVPDIREVMAECAVFVCPILSGSGVRVKLLEAFACGIPVVSTRIGAEGLARVDGEFCRLADDPAAFARAVVETLAGADPAMTERARAEVATNWDMPAITARLVESYRRELVR